MQYIRPSVDDLVECVPAVLRSSRQFLPWNLEAGGKKVPLKADGNSWGDRNDPNGWRTFTDAINLLDRNKAFGVGLVLPSVDEALSLPDFNLISGLVALDADAKHSPATRPYLLPAHLCRYAHFLRSYTEFSPSLKGLRGLAFGTITTDKNSVTKSFGDGTELSLYRHGWVTLSGLVCQGSTSTIEHRQDVIDQMVAELWPNLVGQPLTGAEVPIPIPQGPKTANDFVLDWSRSASHALISQFLHGVNRTMRQSELMLATWELQCTWNHGETPDASMYTHRIVSEALWLMPHFGWAIQDVVDLVITFCKKHGLHWSLGRARKQIADARLRISTRAWQRGAGSVDLDPEFTHDSPTPHPPLTCIRAEISASQIREGDPGSTESKVNVLQGTSEMKKWDTFQPLRRVANKSKLSQALRHKSGARDAVLQKINSYRAWVKPNTIARAIGVSRDSVKKQLQRLHEMGLVDGDGKGHYRKHRERSPRKLKPCSEKPFPKCANGSKQRKTITRGELTKRGWPRTLIDTMFPERGKDYIQWDTFVEALGRRIQTRIYFVSRVHAIEGNPFFEEHRIQHILATAKKRNTGDEQQRLEQ